MTRKLYTPSYPTPAGGGAVQPGFRVKGFGSGVNWLNTPAAQNVDDLTAGLPVPWAVDRQNAKNKVKSESIEGHTNVIEIDSTLGSGWVSFELGGNMNPEDGFRIQWLHYQDNLYCWMWCYLAIQSEADDRIIYMLIGENSTQYRARSLVRDGKGNTYDTGEIQPGGALNGTGNNWSYKRYEWDLNQLICYSHNIHGFPHPGYPKTQVHATSPLPNYPKRVDSISFYSSDGWMDQKIGELWIGTKSDAWPTPGVPTS
jgi:hypothetical protein